LYFFDGKLVCQEGKTDESIESIQKCFEGCPLLSSSTCDDPRRNEACNELDECKVPGKGTQQNLRFSKFDVLYLNNTYPTKLTPEEMTVNYFRDEFSETIGSEDLTEQLEKTREREKFVLDENFDLVPTPTPAPKPPVSVAPLLNINMDVCKEYFNNYFFYILFVLLIIYVILERQNILNSNPLIVVILIVILSLVSNVVFQKLI
jgi:hypothetical protein